MKLILQWIYTSLYKKYESPHIATRHCETSCK